MKIYWWFIHEPVTGRLELGPDDDVPIARRETPFEAIERLGLKDAFVGYAYPLLGGGWRLTDVNHDPLPDPGLAPLVIGAIQAKLGEPQLEAWSVGRWGRGLIELDADGNPAGAHLFCRRCDAREPEGAPTMQEVLRNHRPSGSYVGVTVAPTGVFELRDPRGRDVRDLGPWLEARGGRLRYDPLGTCYWWFIYDIARRRVLLEPDGPPRIEEHELPSEIAPRLGIDEAVVGFAWRRLGGEWTVTEELGSGAPAHEETVGPAVHAELRLRDPLAVPAARGD